MGIRLLVAVVLVSTACSRSPTGPSGAVSISGRVIDFATGAAVPGARVTYGHMASGGTPDPPTAATTTSNGPSGVYAVTLSGIGHYDVWMNDEWAGTTEVTGAAYRGDLLGHGATCVSRYGITADSRTLKPIAGVTVALAGSTATTGADGWYRIDLGCPANGLFGFNTTLIQFQHFAYSEHSQTVGRGVGGVRRYDALLVAR